MGNDNYKQGSDFFMTFSGKKEKSILDFPTKSLQNTLRRVFWTFQQKVSKIPLQYHILIMRIANMFS